MHYYQLKSQIQKGYIITEVSHYQTIPITQLLVSELTVTLKEQESLDCQENDNVYSALS